MDIKRAAMAKTSTGGIPVPTNLVTVEQFKAVVEKVFANKGKRRVDGLLLSAKVLQRVHSLEL